jgi:hypothetical protein
MQIMSVGFHDVKILVYFETEIKPLERNLNYVEKLLLRPEEAAKGIMM